MATEKMALSMAVEREMCRNLGPEKAKRSRDMEEVLESL